MKKGKTQIPFFQVQNNQWPLYMERALLSSYLPSYPDQNPNPKSISSQYRFSASLLIPHISKLNLLCPLLFCLQRILTSRMRIGLYILFKRFLLTYSLQTDTKDRLKSLSLFYCQKSEKRVDVSCLGLSRILKLQSLCGLSEKLLFSTDAKAVRVKV